MITLAIRRHRRRRRCGSGSYNRSSGPPLSSQTPLGNCVPSRLLANGVYFHFLLLCFAHHDTTRHATMLWM